MKAHAKKTAMAVTARADPTITIGATFRVRGDLVSHT